MLSYYCKLIYNFFFTIKNKKIDNYSIYFMEKAIILRKIILSDIIHLYLYKYWIKYLFILYINVLMFKWKKQKRY